MVESEYQKSLSKEIAHHVDSVANQLYGIVTPETVWIMEHLHIKEKKVSEYLKLSPEERKRKTGEHMRLLRTGVPSNKNIRELKEYGKLLSQIQDIMFKLRKLSDKINKTTK
ncbi:MAG: hypothetical protein DRJ47_06170 [Thermoprotei archaeon]|nr:MAG: hypothetical protein DRJ47_06170 [Thermoprotei archaeon]